MPKTKAQDPVQSLRTGLKAQGERQQAEVRCAQTGVLLAYQYSRRVPSSGRAGLTANGSAHDARCHHWVGVDGRLFIGATYASRQRIAGHLYDAIRTLGAPKTRVAPRRKIRPLATIHPVNLKDLGL